LDYVFGKEAPQDSIVYLCKNINSSNAEDIILKHKPDYDFIRTLNLTLSDKAKSAIATYTPSDVLLWWLDQFIGVDSAVKTIVDKSNFTLPYGVLIDKLFFTRKHLTYKQVRYIDSNNMVATRSEPNDGSNIFKLYDRLLSLSEERLNGYSLNLKKPVVVFGDASGSMEVAIKTSSIIMSVLRLLCDAEMNLFRDVCETINSPPTNVKDVITFNEVTKADRATSPASSLASYYLTGKKVNTIILVTDEEENTNSMNMRFWQMFDAYCKKINNVPDVIFISFLQVGQVGQMYNEMQQFYPQYKENVKQFRFDKHAPDLSKLDSILQTYSKIESSVVDNNSVIASIPIQAQVVAV